MKKTYLLALAAMLATTLVSAQTSSRTAPEFIAGGKWFNSKPLSIQDLRGKVTIVNIFVHSCINCHNSLPTLSKWYRQYHDAGLEIIGVHTPEFESDKDPTAAAQSFKQTGVIWPVVQDNKNATWNAYSNRYWPAFYLVDKTGKIREIHEGEISSRYPNAIPGLEKTIQTLLAEKSSAN
jgi:thiol-disulfide isomerase/thioredoxin